MAATAEAPAAAGATALTTTPKQAGGGSKQAEEPVPVVSSLAFLYPDGAFFFSLSLSLSPVALRFVFLICLL